MSRYDDRWWPPPSRPRPAKGGIRSRSRRGAFAESWWGRRWIEVLEGFRIGARLQRGRSYARKGQVLSIQVEPGEVAATVQGSRARPYQVTIALEPLSDGQRTEVAAALAGRPRLAAKLLAGEMPRELEDAFADGGTALFPERHDDLETDCSCPDWSNPCKHIAAVYYLVAEELDRNPFLLLTLRGLGRDDLVGASEGEPRPDEEPERGEEATGAPTGEAGGDPLPSDPDEFWRAAEAVPPSPEPDGEAPEAGPGERAGDAVHLRTLGRIPFWRGKKDPTEALAEMILRGVPLGVEILAGTADDETEPL
jgi:uncharacterized Zn finger protein